MPPQRPYTTCGREQPPHRQRSCRNLQTDATGDARSVGADPPVGSGRGISGRHRRRRRATAMPPTTVAMTLAATSIHAAPAPTPSPIGPGDNGSLQAARSSSLPRSGSCICPTLHRRRHASNNSGHDPRRHLNPRRHFDPHHPCIMSGARVFVDTFARSSSGPSPTTNPIGVPTLPQLAAWHPGSSSLSSLSQLRCTHYPVFFLLILFLFSFFVMD
jgi:hypothetical protein